MWMQRDAQMDAQTDEEERMTPFLTSSDIWGLATRWRFTEFFCIFPI